MCIRDSGSTEAAGSSLISKIVENFDAADTNEDGKVSLQEALAYDQSSQSVSYTHLRAHETVLDLVCRLLLEKKKTTTPTTNSLYYIYIVYRLVSTSKIHPQANT